MITSSGAAGARWELANQAQVVPSQACSALCPGQASEGTTSASRWVPEELVPLLGHLAAGMPAQSQGFVCITMNSFSCLSFFVLSFQSCLLSSSQAPPKDPHRWFPSKYSSPPQPLEPGRWLHLPSPGLQAPSAR